MIHEKEAFIIHELSNILKMHNNLEILEFISLDYPKIISGMSSDIFVAVIIFIYKISNRNFRFYNSIQLLKWIFGGKIFKLSFGSKISLENTIKDKWFQTQVEQNSL